VPGVPAPVKAEQRQAARVISNAADGWDERTDHHLGAGGKEVHCLVGKRCLGMGEKASGAGTLLHRATLVQHLNSWKRIPQQGSWCNMYSGAFCEAQASSGTCFLERKSVLSFLPLGLLCKVLLVRTLCSTHLEDAVLAQLDMR
jgi:hypothetical protein